MNRTAFAATALCCLALCALAPAAPAAPAQAVRQREPRYAYEVAVLNGGELYTESPIVLYVKTDCPYPDYFDIEGDVEPSRVSARFADIPYADNYNAYTPNGFRMCRVAGGYIATAQSPRTGDAGWEIYEFLDGEYYPAASGTIRVDRDYRSAKREWMRSLIVDWQPFSGHFLQRLRPASLNSTGLM